jgi:hypothetical protein
MGGGPVGLHALMFPAPDQQRFEAAATLNGEIASEEVHCTKLGMARQLVWMGSRSSS